MADQQQKRSYPAVRVATAVVVGASLATLSALILAGTVGLLTLATPLLLMFSPVLLPAAIAVFLAAMGFLSSGGAAAFAVSVLAWAWRHTTGMWPKRGAEELAAGRKYAEEVKERVKQYVHLVQARAEEAVARAG